MRSAAFLAIVLRPAVDQRELVPVAELDVEQGVLGDTWRSRGNRHMPDGAADPRAQVTIMNARFARLIAGEGAERWARAGDQLYVDFDLSIEHLPPGTRLEIGDAQLEVSDKPRTGCAKFAARFGEDALRFVGSPEGRVLRLRGMDARGRRRDGPRWRLHRRRGDGVGRPRPRARPGAGRRRFDLAGPKSQV